MSKHTKPHKAKHQTNLKRLHRINPVEVKYLDNLILAQSPGAGFNLFRVSAVPQGAAQGQRVGDFIQPLKLILNFSLYAATSDIVNTVRRFLVRWKPSDTLIVPLIADFLEAAASANVLSHFNFQLQDNYDILFNKFYAMAGIPASPTSISAISGEIVFHLGRNPPIEFGLATNSGTNHLYFCEGSDNTVVPFPLSNLSFRLYYQDVDRLSEPRKMLK